MFWPLVSGAGFVLAVGVVIVLARDGTARWEQEREATEREATDEEIRRQKARRRAKATRSATVAAPTTRRRHWDRPHVAGRSSGRR